MRKGDYEILAARGRLSNNTTPVYLFVVYLPPWLCKSRLEAYLGILRDAITKAKLDDTRPLIMVGGDWNGYDIRQAHDDFLDISGVSAPPTRNTERLERIYCNDADAFTADVCPPLEAASGSQSDHLILNAVMKLSHRHEIHWIQYRTRAMTKKNIERFVKLYCGIDWQSKIGGFD